MQRDRRFLRALALLASLAVPAAPAHARPAAALSSGGDAIFLFDTSNPAQVTNTLSFLSYLGANETIVAIDARTDTGVLYALGRVSSGGDVLRLYRVDLKSGALRPVGAPLAAVTFGVQYGFDYNPAVGRFRVVNTGGIGNGGINIRINPDTGALVATDTNLTPEGTFTNAIAYDRNVDGATQTTLYAFSAGLNSLTRIGGIDGLPSANGGVVTAVGPIGVNIDADVGVGLDIAGANEAYATFQDGTTQKCGLYRVDLATGAATLVGLIGDGNSAVSDLALLFTPDRLYALSAEGGKLLGFDSDSAGTVDEIAVSGVAAGEALVGIDYRPATGGLYGLARGNNVLGDFVHLYRLDESTGVAAPLAFAVPSLTAGSRYGIDFNPVSDRLRVVNTSDLNLRIEPELGTRVDSPPDDTLTPAGRGVDAVAYDRNLARAASATTLFGLARSDNKLVRIGGVDGVPSPNGGGVTDVGGLGRVIDPGGGVGLDIGDRGRAYAAFTDNPSGSTALFRIDLVTGAATLIERIENGTVAVSGLAVRPNNVFRDSFE